MRDDAQHAGALSIPVQAGSEQETTQLARLSVELCVKAVGQGDQALLYRCPILWTPRSTLHYSKAAAREGIEHRQNGAACVF